MTEQGQSDLAPEIEAWAQEFDHVREHLEDHYAEATEYPMHVEELGDEHEAKQPNLFYSLDEDNGIFAHIYGDIGVELEYKIIEPKLTNKVNEVYNKVRAAVIRESINHEAMQDGLQNEDTLRDIYEEITTTQRTNSLLSQATNIFEQSKVYVPEEMHDVIRYYLIRDTIGLGPLEPLTMDPTVEDIHMMGYDECYMDHGVFSMLPTDLEFPSSEEYDRWLRNIGERIGEPVNDADPITDSTLPDGSRINIIYSDDVSVKGPSLTIRQKEGDALTITQIVNFGTLSPELAAYLWICLENDQTMFVVGETASGKTTTLNCIMTFIPRDSKIFTAEDTLEVQPPHKNWQQLLTREGRDESASVDLFDLVRTALRSRPNYIVVGEVRGEEGRMAFQAAQTGHPVLLTFHAKDIVSMIQRFTGDPINAPEKFMDNCNVALFQNRIQTHDGRVARRVTSVCEIEGYSDEFEGVVSREVFTYDSANDNLMFTGYNNSYILEQKVAPLMGLSDPIEVYDHLEEKKEIIEKMIENEIFTPEEVNGTIAAYQQDGEEGLPFGLQNSVD